MESEIVLTFNNPPLQVINHPLLKKKNIHLQVLRLDLIHPYISGNKWFKLKHNLLEAKKQNHDTLLTFGGAFSNHIYAAATAGALFGFKTIGVIRGEEHLPLNSTLSHAQNQGMHLHYIDRSLYRQKKSSDFIKSLQKEFGDFYLIPEGGSNQLALNGVAEIISFLNFSYDYIATPVGTGGTIAGLIKELDGKNKIIGFPVLKGASFLYSDIFTLLGDAFSRYKNWTLSLDYHFGGYAKTNNMLNNFISEFVSSTNIPIEFVYSGKMFFGLFDLIEHDYFPAGTSIIALHTGGLRNDAGN
jgi:1-aminocyclopropane-1-carboxylate deaminase